MTVLSPLKDVENWNAQWESKTCKHFGKHFAVLKIKRTMYSPYETFLGIYPREMETIYPYEDLDTNVHAALFITASNRK